MSIWSLLKHTKRRYVILKFVDINQVMCWSVPVACGSASPRDDDGVAEA